ncbi:unnamed protein product, partial [Choristocarpus tenellus]
QFVESLEKKGIPRDQAVALMDQVLLAITEANDKQIVLVATKQDLVDFKSELIEKVFNSTLKFDIAQRHLKELVQRDMDSVKFDIRQEEKSDFALLQKEIGELEKRTFVRREADEIRYANLQQEISSLEKRVM